MGKQYDKIYKIKRLSSSFSSLIYQNENEQNPAVEEEQFVTEYMMIKAKKIEYLDSPVIAVYLTNVTQHVN